MANNIDKSPKRRMGHGPNALSLPPEKPKDMKKTLKRLLQYLNVYIPFVVLAIVFSVAGNIISIIGPGRLGKISDLIQQGLATTIDLDAVTKIAIGLAILYLFGFVFNYFQGFIMSTIAQKTTFKLRDEVCGKINRLPLKYFDNNSFGDVMSRVTNDVDTVGNMLNQSVGSLISSSVQFFGALIVMYLTNALLATAALLSTGLGFFLMSFIISKSQKYFVEQQKSIGQMNGHIEEIYTGHSIVKAYNGEKDALNTFYNINNTLQDSAWKSQFLSGLMMPVMHFIGNFSYVIVCVLGAWLALNGTITFGVIVAFMIYVRLFTQPLATLAQGMTQIQTATAAGDRVFEFLDEAELSDETQKTASLDNIKGNVEFSHVHFGYDEDKTVINDFSAAVKSGQKVAIVGPTGAGKTTIVNLLMRFYELHSGDITIDGVPLSDLKRENIHDLFCMVLQDTWLFEGTVKENIKYNTNATDEEIINACKMANIHHFIMTLPDGYNTILTENDSISQGQKQLITIARAMVKNSPMLILDEATSSVDTRTEALIQQAMDTLMHGRTSFVIAHRLSTIKNADIILVLKDGDIFESGTHEDLLAINGFYANLYNSQFEETA